MKKLLLISLVVLLDSCTSKYKYLIKDERGGYYLCNFYNKTKDGCIMFNDKPGYDNAPGFPTRHSCFRKSEIIIYINLDIISPPSSTGGVFYLTKFQKIIILFL